MNIMQTAKLVKIVVNCGMGEALADKKTIEKMGAQLASLRGRSRWSVGPSGPFRRLNCGQETRLVCGLLFAVNA